MSSTQGTVSLRGTYLHLCPACLTTHTLEEPCGVPALPSADLTGPERVLLLEALAEFQENHSGWDSYPRSDGKRTEHISMKKLRAKLSQPLDRGRRWAALWHGKARRLHHALVAATDSIRLLQESISNAMGGSRDG